MKTFLLVLIIPTFLVISNVLKDKVSFPELVISKEEKMVSFNQDFIRVFSAGQKRIISNILWIHTMLEGDIEKVNDENSWMYHRFKSISTLEPYFYENYIYGGIYLSIIKDDVEGASDIYNLGISYYKDDFWLNYNSAFNDYFELHDHASALKKYKIVLKSPLAKQYASHLPSLVSRIQAETGGLNDAYILLANYYNSTPQGVLKDRLRKNLYGLRAEIDLNCLNLGKTGCREKDLNGDPYLLIDGKYKAMNDWVKFRPKKKRRTKSSSGNQ